MLQKCLPRKTKTDFDSDWGRRGEDVLFLNVVLKQDRERGEKERTARKHRRDFDLQSKKENRDFFGCHWKLEGLEMPKGWFTLMRKAIAQQQEGC